MSDRISAGDVLKVTFGIIFLAVAAIMALFLVGLFLGNVIIAPVLVLLGHQVPTYTGVEAFALAVSFPIVLGIVSYATASVVATTYNTFTGETA